MNESHYTLWAKLGRVWVRTDMVESIVYHTDGDANWSQITMASGATYQVPYTPTEVIHRLRRMEDE